MVVRPKEGGGGGSVAPGRLWALLTATLHTHRPSRTRFSDFLKEVRNMDYMKYPKC